MIRFIFMFKSFKSYQPNLPGYVNAKKIGHNKMLSREDSFARELLFADQSLLYNRCHPEKRWKHPIYSLLDRLLH